jgi:hypothetical protein
MKLRRLNERGLRAFQALLAEARDGVAVSPQTLLDDDSMSEPTAVDVEVQVTDFGSRLEAGRYFTELLEPHRQALGSVERDAKLWAWLSLAWFDVLAPADAESGRRRPGSDYRWIPQSGNFRTYYRHLLAGPYRIYRAHRDNPDRALAVLAGPVGAPGDVVEQIASHQEFIASESLMQVATDLYYDSESSSIKSGAAGRSHGSARRLVAVVQQFDRTWDFNERSAAEILSMLPSEFQRFR